MLFAEAEGQKLIQGMNSIFLAAGEYDLKIIAAELPHRLTAHAAGRERVGRRYTVFAADDGDSNEITLSLVYRRGKGYTLGAHGGRKCGILNISSAEYPAVSTQKRTPH